MVIWAHVALAGVWGGLLSLERRAFLQAMFSRPLVAATGMGLLLEDVESGLYIGLLLELFHLGVASLGAVLPDNDTVAATSSAAFAAAMSNVAGGGTPAIWSLAILLFLPAGQLGRRLERWLERYTAHLGSQAIASVGRGDLKHALRLNLFGMWPHFVVFGCLSALAAGLGYLLAPYEARLPGVLLRGLAWAYPAMASVAAALAVRGSHAQHAGRFALAAAGLVAGLSVLQWNTGGTLW